jgi:hypothetical protein
MGAKQRPCCVWDYAIDRNYFSGGSDKLPHDRVQETGGKPAGLAGGPPLEESHTRFDFLVKWISEKYPASLR